ncbi:hypothetical protein SAMN06265795_11512 [Noviherbaspirillum humi]|uniref:Pyridoxal phosphate homeostasis protein n=1 Tax=Noviherbaspirillum humi TaxID=1688639 RepID=A0A239K8V7_9BURK|nr:YggS family pyridoxal phosphate-dependent enzyme [Noviherbaspirillum humi]SNT14102.1 hypothetical protein SAMN06265795_11512 [Noviherbaspirillum humi]
MSPVSQNLQAVRRRIAAAAEAVSREPHSVALLAVSKTFGPEAVAEAAAAGQLAFGENYLQEALDKMDAVTSLLPASRPKLEWHFIGPIQSNKTRPIAERFDWVHSVDREKIARRLSEQRPQGAPPLDICLQVNISEEASKSGMPAEEALPLARAVSTLPNLRLRGLMAIPEPTDDVARQRREFARLRELMEAIRHAGIPMDTLSMGMSADLEAAVAEGATIVRIGTAIFGKRDYAK